MTSDDILFPGVAMPNWQMTLSEKMALTGILSRLNPRGALEIGVYYGGSLTLAAPYCERIVAIDIDPDVVDRFDVPSNAEILIAPSSESIPMALKRLDDLGLPLNYVLIDADHSAAGVRADIERVLAYQPREHLAILVHDSGNPECREGMKLADWASNPYVQWVELDIVPGQIIEHTVASGKPEVWGGLAMAWLSSAPRRAPLSIGQGSKTSIQAVHEFSRARTV